MVEHDVLLSVALRLTLTLTGRGERMRASGPVQRAVGCHVRFVGYAGRLLSRLSSPHRRLQLVSSEDIFVQTEEVGATRT